MRKNVQSFILFLVLGIVTGCAPSLRVHQFDLPPAVATGHAAEAMQVYRGKLLPLLNELSTRVSHKQYEGTEPMLVQALDHVSALEQATMRLQAATARDQQVVEFAARLRDFCTTVRSYCTLSQGYNDARTNRRLSFLTKENEDRFNALSDRLKQETGWLNSRATQLSAGM